MVIEIYTQPKREKRKENKLNNYVTNKKNDHIFTLAHFF